MIVNLSPAMGALCDISAYSSAVTSFLTASRDAKLTVLHKDMKNLSVGLERLSVLSDLLNFPVSRYTSNAAKLAVDKICAQSDEDHVLPANDASELARLFTAVRNSVLIEIMSATTMATSHRHGSLLTEGVNPFGPTVSEVFPEMDYDLLSAGQCIALEQSTAAVFHLMRAMEAAVRQIAHSLGITDLEREWGPLVGHIGGKVNAIPKGKRRDRWSEIHALLYHVKEAWRNTTMHPDRSYTDEQAEEIFNAVGAFLKSLATQLKDEAALDGEPHSVLKHG